jgi:hypothetical protein
VVDRLGMKFDQEIAVFRQVHVQQHIHRFAGGGDGRGAGRGGRSRRAGGGEGGRGLAGFDGVERPGQPLERGERAR